MLGMTEHEPTYKCELCDEDCVDPLRNQWVVVFMGSDNEYHLCSVECFQAWAANPTGT